MPRVREIHNLSARHVGGGLELSLHLKLPGDAAARGGARRSPSSSSARSSRAVPEIDAVQTHLEPLAEPSRRARSGRRRGAVERDRARGDRPAAARAAASCAPTTGLVAFLTLGLDAEPTLADAHARASEIEERIRRAQPEIADVIVHTEP